MTKETKHILPLYNTESALSNELLGALLSPVRIYWSTDYKLAMILGE